MKKIKVKVNNKKYLIMHDKDILHIYEIINKKGAGKLVFKRQ